MALVLMIWITKADKVEYWHGGGRGVEELSEEVESLAHISTKYTYNSKCKYF